MRETLEALLARVEKAEGSDRELDGGLAAMHGWRNVMEPVGDKTLSCWYSPDGVEKFLPAYTSSIDAAVSLVEKMLPGWGWQTGCPLPYDKPRVYYASVWKNGLHVGHDGWVHEDGKPMPPRPTPAIYRPTAPLALIAALLKALIATDAAAPIKPSEKEG